MQFKSTMQTSDLFCTDLDLILQVSWIRHHDLHILTVGKYTYTADMRFRSIYSGASDEWVMQIQYVQKRDAGRYECQINTQPVRSYFVQLQVVGKECAPGKARARATGFEVGSVWILVTNKNFHLSCLLFVARPTLF